MNRCLLNVCLATILSLILGCSVSTELEGTTDVPQEAVFPPGSADPEVQNEIGGSGAPLETEIPSQFVLFQDDFTSRLVNRDGGTTQQNGVAGSYGIGAYADPNDSNKLKFFVNDKSNHRILIFNSIPSDASAQPDVVVGQTNFTTGVVNGGSGAGNTNAFGFDQSIHVSVCSTGEMLVSDRNNNRVMIYNRIPTTSGKSADVVIGQIDFMSNASGTTANTLNTPYAAYCHGGKVFVLDRGNHRILVFNSIPTVNQTSANFAIGQPDLVSGSSGCSSSQFNTMYEFGFANDKLYVADGANHRVLMFNSIPSNYGASADVVVGQPDMNSCSVNAGAGAGNPTANSMYYPNSLAFKEGYMAVSDHSNNRYLFFALPLTSDESASHVYGQPDFVTSTVVDPPTASSVRATKGLIFDEDYMWVSDNGNKRIGVFPLPF